MNLDLYFFESCPYCQIVLSCIDDLNLKVNFCNIQESAEHRAFLLNTTGRYTVPCMFIDGKPMHESMDIIKWLNNNHQNLEKTIYMCSRQNQNII